ncbi:MAG: type I-D CRISPR-associated protein Cas7/Csc2 [Methanocellales archaeon]|nr:type I-D CRISPR-associated protein Cas7/Csc2 [Methanocellales archaeon]
MEILKELGLEDKARYFGEEIPRVPEEKYTMIVLLRETKSHCVFTTEIDVLNVARVEAGKENSEMIDRVVMFKRKQVAPERRSGKRLLREYEFMKLEDCYLMDNVCCECPDCLLYGGIRAETSQKARIYYDNAYTIREYDRVHERLTLTAIDEKTGRPGAAFTDVDHLKPNVVLPCVVTLHNVTPGEFAYVLLNIMRTKRYGAEVTRIGSVENHIVGLIFSTAECISNLDLTQALYDRLVKEKGKPLKELAYNDVEKHIDEVIKQLIAKKPVKADVVTKNETEKVVSKFIENYKNEENVKGLLENLMTQAKAYVKKYQR